MNKFISSLITFVAALSFAGQAYGQGAVEEKNLLSGKTQIDPNSGYIFQSGPARTFGIFLKVANDQEVAAYEKKWAEELAKEHKKYLDKLESWERDAKWAKRDNVKIRPKPEEPTPENFTIGPIELLNPVSFGPQFAFAKGKDPETYSYLNEVQPGTYVYYGPVIYAQAVSGYCYCMGTVKFDVKPGTITDLGNFFFSLPLEDPAFPRENTKVEGAEAGLYGKIVGNPKREDPSYGVPDSLKKYPYQRAELHASGKLDNFYGLTITRMPPIPGVLAYERDIAIDLAGSSPSPATSFGQLSVAGEPVSNAEK